MHICLNSFGVTFDQMPPYVIGCPLNWSLYSAHSLTHPFSMVYDLLTVTGLVFVVTSGVIVHDYFRLLSRKQVQRIIDETRIDGIEKQCLRG